MAILSARGRRMLHLKKAVSSTGITALKQNESDRGRSILVAAVSAIAESSGAMRMFMFFEELISYHITSHHTQW